jgi:hypothetical protein
MPPEDRNPEEADARRADIDAGLDYVLSHDTELLARLEEA